MSTPRLTGPITGLLVGVFSAALPLQAHEFVFRGPVKANDVLLTMNLDALNRESTSKLCRVALTQALNEEEFNVVTSRSKADVELVLTGGFLTITEGRAGRIGNAHLSYSAELRDMHGHTILSLVDDAEGDSVAEVCTDVASDIAEEVEDALDD